MSSKRAERAIRWNDAGQLCQTGGRNSTQRLVPVLGDEQRSKPEGNGLYLKPRQAYTRFLIAANRVRVHGVLLRPSQSCHMKGTRLFTELAPDLMTCLLRPERAGERRDPVLAQGYFYARPVRLWITFRRSRDVGANGKVFSDR